MKKKPTLGIAGWSFPTKCRADAEAERQGNKLGLRQRQRDSNNESMARARYNVDRMTRCKVCMAEYERYARHCGYCQDCH